MVKVLILVLIAAILIVYVIRHTHGKDYTPQKKQPADEQLTKEEVDNLYVDGELTTRAGYLHYTLSEAFETSDDNLGVFTGIVKPDAQHDGKLLVYDSEGMIRGTIADQKDYYAALLNRRQANCYGFVAHDGGKYHGEVCIRNITA